MPYLSIVLPTFRIIAQLIPIEHLALACMLRKGVSG